MTPPPKIPIDDDVIPLGGLSNKGFVSGCLIGRRVAFVILAFALSTMITGLFIRAYDGYVSTETMLLSGTIAGGKWAIQLAAGWLLLGEKRWLYIGQLAATCLIGSLTLLPFAVLSGGPVFFFGSLIGCIVVMTANIILRQRATRISWKWSALWLAMLGIAVSLQLTVVFHLL